MRALFQQEVRTINGNGVGAGLVKRCIRRERGGGTGEEKTKEDTQTEISHHRLAESAVFFFWGNIASTTTRYVFIFLSALLLHSTLQPTLSVSPSKLRKSFPPFVSPPPPVVGSKNM